MREYEIRFDLEIEILEETILLNNLKGLSNGANGPYSEDDGNGVHESKIKRNKSDRMRSQRLRLEK